MEYKAEMNLVSDSGYAMPFDARNRELDIKFLYGEQPHPKTGEPWFHHGIDFRTDKYKLLALATGVVSGVGVDREEHGLKLTIKYGGYEVTYAGMSNVYAQFGQKVRAGACVGLSTDVLHLGVTFEGKEMDPTDFLTMLVGHEHMWRQSQSSTPETFYVDSPMGTEYDQHADEIEKLMMNYMPQYVNDIQNGAYQVPEYTISSLRRIYEQGQQRGLFYQEMPTAYNPLGLGESALPMIIKAQNLLIKDFLNYMSLIQNIFLSGTSPMDQKKNMTMM